MYAKTGEDSGCKERKNVLSSVDAKSRNGQEQPFITCIIAKKKRNVK